MAILLFVYGTLKRGQASHDLLQGQEYLGEALTAPHYRLYDAGRFPVLVAARAAGRSIRGEVWRVDDACLRVLDAWEDVPRLYVRRRVDLANMSEPVSAYIFTGDISTYRDCGDEWP